MRRLREWVRCELAHRRALRLSRIGRWDPTPPRAPQAGHPGGWRYLTCRHKGCTQQSRFVATVPQASPAMTMKRRWEPAEAAMYRCAAAHVWLLPLPMRAEVFPDFGPARTIVGPP